MLESLLLYSILFPILLFVVNVSFVVIMFCGVPWKKRWKILLVWFLLSLPVILLVLNVYGVISL